jgi:large subunit ribosomal protein L25
MNEVILEVKKRETGKKIANSLRNSDYVPGVFYVKGTENINIYAKTLDLRPIVYTSQTKIVDLKIEGESTTYQCILKDIQLDPVTDKIVHFDLQGLVPGQKLTVELPIKLIGQPVGVRQGGKLMQTLHKLKVKILPKDLVEAIEANIAQLNIGESLYVKDLNIQNFEIDINPDTVVVSVTKPRGAQ